MKVFFNNLTSSLIIFFIALFFCLCFYVSPTLAQIIPDDSPVDIGNLLENIPNLKQGGIYSVQDKVIKYCSTLTVFKDIFNVQGLNVEAGGAPVYNELLIGVSFELIKIKDHVTFPLLDLIEFNIGYSLGMIDLFEKNKFDHGPWATAINLKF